jgi:hypothetical protein
MTNGFLDNLPDLGLNPKERKKPHSNIERKETGDEIYAFPTRSRCPGCKSVKTTAYRTDGKVQYRRCECGKTYTVIGVKI